MHVPLDRAVRANTKHFGHWRVASTHVCALYGNSVVKRALYGHAWIAQTYALLVTVSVVKSVIDSIVLRLICSAYYTHETNQIKGRLD